MKDPFGIVVTTRLGEVPSYIYDACEAFVAVDRRIQAIKLVRAYVQDTYPDFRDNDGHHLFGLAQAKRWIVERFVDGRSEQ